MTGTPHLPRLQLLGVFRLTGAAGEELRLSSRKAKALLAVVALAPGQNTIRARLRALLWSDRGEDQASASLRQLLVVLRKELAPLGPGLLRAQDDNVGLDPDALEIDTSQFIAAESAGDAAQSIANYGGPLLDGLDLGDQAFEDWLATERRRFLHLAIGVFEARATELSGEARVAIAQRLVALDPLREASHRALIAAYQANGEAALARKQFETCKAMLTRELGVAPAAETEALLVKPQAAASNAKPSIAVLTFANFSDDPNQRYFSDGITADIVTELSRFHQLLVRAVKGKHEGDALTAGRELGVHYLAEGSVRRLGKRIRINVQLLDVETGQNLWAERFDADEEEVFSVQDRIVRSIAAQLSRNLRLADFEKASRKPPNSLAAYDYILRGDALPIGVPEAEAEARRLFQKAIDLDPGYARAHAHLAEYKLLQWVGELEAPAALLDQSLELARRAVGLDDSDDFCHVVLGDAQLRHGLHELAEYHFQRALSLNPNRPGNHVSLGIMLGFSGEPERGLTYLREAIVVDPFFNPTWYWRNRAVVHYAARAYEEAIAGFRRSPIQPDWVEAYLGACHSHLGRTHDARRHGEAAMRLTPHLTISAFLKKEPYRRPEDAEHLAEGLRKAGIPE
jgi:TolB-like protein/Tfp pilus assembly protein PilF